MKHLFLSIFSGVVVTVSVLAIAAQNLTFAEVVDNVNRNVHSKLNAREYWNRVKGQQVSWSGEVFDVESGKSQARILVTDKSRPLYKG